MSSRVFLITLILVFFLFTSCKKDNNPTEPVLETTTKTVDNSGGTITVNNVSVTVKPGTFSKNVIFTISKDTKVPVSVDENIGTYDKNNIYKITVSSTDSIKTPIQVTIPYNPSIIPAGYTEADLAVVHVKESGYKFEQVFVDMANQKLIFETTNFSWFAAGVPKHKVELPTDYTTLNKLIDFNNATIPSTSIQSYDYSYDINSYTGHDNFYWGVMQVPSEIDQGGNHGKVAYASRFMNNDYNSSMNSKSDVNSCLTFKLDLSQSQSASVEFDYNANSRYYGELVVEIANSSLTTPLTQAAISWGNLIFLNMPPYKSTNGNGVWQHIKLNFPSTMTNLKFESINTCGSSISKNTFVRFRFNTWATGNYPNTYAPFIDNIIFKTDQYNEPPTLPFNPIPNDNATNQQLNTSLSWSCSDPENDPIKYDIYIGQQFPPTTKLSSSQAGTSYNLTGLTNNTSYYWQIHAKDDHNNSTTGPVWKFATLASSSTPTVTTNSVSNITENSATCGGNVTSQGSLAVTARGVCWSTSQNPTTSNSKTIDGSGTGGYTSSLTGLSSNTQYYVRAYATNSAGTSYGNQVSFNTSNNPNATLPSVTTNSATNINASSATSGGNVTAQGSTLVTARGVCWSTSPNPTTSNSKTTDGSGTGSYTSSITGLSSNTTYYVRAYATNSIGTSYGSQVSFTTTTGGSGGGTPCLGTPTVTYAGKTYNTVQIGTQCWLKENLDVGTMIQGIQEQTNNNTIEKYCYYDDANNCNTYGGLYQWAEAVQYKNGATNTTSPNPAFSGIVQGICPSGWHIPSQAEFQTLQTAVNNSRDALLAVGELSGKNTSGFSVLISGERTNNGYYANLSVEAVFWSSTVNYSSHAYYMGLWVGNPYVTVIDFYKTYGLSVRCLKN